MAVANATESAIEAWKRRIEAHNAQSLRARGNRPQDEDWWSSLAGGFRADPKRTDDPVADLLASWVTSETTVLDVGGGAGRYALPLALRCKHVSVVEPSPSMVMQLREAAKEAGMENVSAVEARWEEAEVEQADLVLCANVVYGVAEIEPFLKKLDRSARERVVIVVFMDAPSSMLSPLWKAVHGEERIDLPALPQLLPVLWEMGIFPNLEMLAAPPRYSPNIDAAIAIARHMLHVEAGTEKGERLQKAARELAVETLEGVTLRRQTARPLGVVWWRPAGAA
jgi:2-polyprenyl-3-methyl-5-hydroxy-6-metoxy-1,4-benzoquinol methylase